jgi:hypothetical protein
MDRFHLVSIIRKTIYIMLIIEFLFIIIYSSLLIGILNLVSNDLLTLAIVFSIFQFFILFTVSIYIILRK